MVFDSKKPFEITGFGCVVYDHFLTTSILFICCRLFPLSFCLFGLTMFPLSSLLHSYTSFHCRFPLSLFTLFVRFSMLFDSLKRHSLFLSHANLYSFHSLYVSFVISVCVCVLVFFSFRIALLKHT